MKVETKITFTARDIERAVGMVYGIDVRGAELKKNNRGSICLVCEDSESKSLADYHSQLEFVIEFAKKFGLKFMEIDKEKFAKEHGMLGLNILKKHRVV